MLCGAGMDSTGLGFDGKSRSPVLGNTRVERDVLIFASPELTAFRRNDTNNLVSFGATDRLAGESTSPSFATKENTFFDAPTLDVSFVPEPSIYVLLHLDLVGLCAGGIAELAQAACKYGLPARPLVQAKPVIDTRAFLLAGRALQRRR